MELMMRLWNDDEGQDIAEYALLLAVVLVLVIGVVTTLGKNAQTIFSSVGAKLGSAAGAQ